MKRNLLVAILLVGMPIVSVGQRLEKIKQLCLTRDLGQLDAYFNHLKHSAKKEEVNYSASNSYKRTILQYYREAILYYEELIPLDTNPPKVHRLYHYELHLICQGQSIIYCQLLDKSNSYHLKMLVEYADQAKMGDLEQAYLGFYHCSFKLQELFDRAVAYGTVCGKSGPALPQRQAIEQQISNRDMSAIEAWLQSANLEKQVYGVEACFRLQAEGVVLSKQQLEWIHQIKNKEGSVSTCSGCLSFRQAMLEVLKEYQF